MKRKTSGSSLGLLILLACASGAVCGSEKKAPPIGDAEPHAVVAGTVFRGTGLSLPGATVTLALRDAPKAKKLQSVSDGRGEFAFRVRPVEATYIVRASLKGFEAAEKEVSVSGEERVEVTLTMEPASK